MKKLLLILLLTASAAQAITSITNDGLGGFTIWEPTGPTRITPDGFGGFTVWD